MCNCGRKAPDVVTTAQAEQSEAMRRAQDSEYQAEILQASAANALSNASTGWFAVESAQV